VFFVLTYCLGYSHTFTMNPQVANHKGSVTRCQSEGSHDISPGPLSRPNPNNQILWGMISLTATQYKITQ